MDIGFFSKNFRTHEDALNHLEYTRWGDKVICVYCQSSKTCKHKENNRYRWQCWGCKKSFAATVGTIFHRSHVGLDKWFMLIVIMEKTNNQISAYKASEYLGVRRVTVWSMMNRINNAMNSTQSQLLKKIITIYE